MLEKILLCKIFIRPAPFSPLRKLLGPKYKIVPNTKKTDRLLIDRIAD